MLHRLLRLNALKAFEGAARHESFTRVAEKAVHHGGGCEPPGQGAGGGTRHQAFQAGGPRCAAIGSPLVLTRLVQRQSSGVLTVSTSPDFAAKWLVHRLGRSAEVAPAFAEFPAPDLAARRAHRARVQAALAALRAVAPHTVLTGQSRAMLSKVAQAGGVP
jgi:hypothetical protein